MVFSFARIGAVIQMKVGDYFVQGRRRWVRLHEKGGKEHDVPCHHRLDQCLQDYIEVAGIADDVDGYLFRSARRKTGQLTTNPLFQQDAHRIIRRRAKAAGIETRIGNHTFRATGITAYLKNSGKLEVAQQIANHELPRTTKLYDRRNDEISLDESSELRSKKLIHLCHDPNASGYLQVVIERHGATGGVRIQVVSNVRADVKD